jgi:hypothetical protein
LLAAAAWAGGREPTAPSRTPGPSRGDGRTSPPVELSAAERAQYERWIATYLGIQEAREIGRVELGTLAQRLREESHKRDAFLFDPTRSGRIESLMRQLHKVNEQDAPQRERLDALRQTMRPHSQRLLPVIHERIDAIENQRKTEPGITKEQAALLANRAGALRKLEGQLRWLSRGAPGAGQSVAALPRLDDKFFDQLYARLDRIDRALEEIGSAGGATHDQIGFLLDLVDVLWRQTAAPLPRDGRKGAAVNAKPGIAPRP